MAASSASSARPVDHVELYFQRDDVAGKEQELEATLGRQAGVAGAALVPHPSPSAEVCVRVSFDPTLTNPVILEEALGREGFTVLSASEEPQPAASRRSSVPS